jgi:hypothetical protein
VWHVCTQANEYKGISRQTFRVGAAHTVALQQVVYTDVMLRWGGYAGRALSVVLHALSGSPPAGVGARVVPLGTARQQGAMSRDCFNYLCCMVQSDATTQT